MEILSGLFRCPQLVNWYGRTLIFRALVNRGIGGSTGICWRIHKIEFVEMVLFALASSGRVQWGNLDFLRSRFVIGNILSLIIRIHFRRIFSFRLEGSETVVGKIQGKWEGSPQEKKRGQIHAG